MDRPSGKLNKLPLGRIRPEGWLLRELRLQADGLTGRLGEIWPDVSGNSAWLGGDGEAWERGPYYLNGLVPLAFLLNDRRLRDRVDTWVGRILRSADEKGFFGPARNADWWPRMICLNALASYREATGDTQILPFFKKFFEYQLSALDRRPLEMWASARAAEEMIPLRVVFDSDDPSLAVNLAVKLVKQSRDWEFCFRRFRYRKPGERYVSGTLVNLATALGKRADRKRKYGGDPPKRQPGRAGIRFANGLPTVKKMMLLHGVNNAMAIKYPLLVNDLIPQPDPEALSLRTVRNLMRYHGTAAGAFTSDEILSGNSPLRGIELCAVVEFMRSLEEMLVRTGEPYYADLLETACFNALPAMITAGFTAHQYVQQTNCASAGRGRRGFFNVGPDGTLFGLEPNFGCCTANMHQGFPKFTEHLCYPMEGGFAFMVYAPCLIDAGEGMFFREITDYPFGEVSEIRVERCPAERNVKLCFRVPEHTALSVTVNGVRTSYGTEGVVEIERTVRAGDVFRLEFVRPLTTVSNPDRTISFRKGTLVMATKLKTIAEREGTSPFGDVEFRSATQWRTLPVTRNGAPEVLAERTNPVPEMPFDESRPPIEIDYRAKYVSNWPEENDGPGKVPSRPECAGNLTRTLVPYGCTRIRIAHHPVYRG